MNSAVLKVIMDNVDRGTLQTKKSVLVVKSATYTLGGGENLGLETLPTFSVNISQNRSDCENSFGLFKVNVTCLNRLYFSINFYDEFLRFSTSKNG